MQTEWPPYARPLLLAVGCTVLALAALALEMNPWWARVAGLVAAVWTLNAAWVLWTERPGRL